MNQGISLRVFSAALVLALSGTPALAKSDGRTLSQSTASVDIFNFGQINPSYYRGGELEGSGADELAGLGVKTVIDLRSDEDLKAIEAQQVAQAGMKYVRIPMSTRIAPTDDQIATFLKLVSDPANQPVYVHCIGGKHRTGVMTAIYRMTVDKWTPDQAFSEMKRFKFGMDMMHPEFKKFVYTYRPATLPAAVEAAGLKAGAAEVATN